MSRGRHGSSPAHSGDPPERLRSKIAERFILVLRALLFLLQFVVFALSFVLHHLGSVLMALGRLRDVPRDDDPLANPPLSSPNQPPEP